MRPAGGYTSDMMNYARSMDVYQIWADMVLIIAGFRQILTRITSVFMPDGGISSAMFILQRKLARNMAIILLRLRE